jgi:hypothetical protein
MFHHFQAALSSLLGIGPQVRLFILPPSLDPPLSRREGAVLARWTQWNDPKREVT